MTMRLRRLPAARQGGFTLVELLIAMVLVGVVATAVYASFISGVEASSSRDLQARTQNSARGAIDEFTRDVRQAVSPDGIIPPVAAAPTATSIELWVDNNRSLTATTATPVRVRYSLSGTNFVRQTLSGTTWFDGGGPRLGRRQRIDRPLHLGRHQRRRDGDSRCRRHHLAPADPRRSRRAGHHDHGAPGRCHAQEPFCVGPASPGRA